MTALHLKGRHELGDFGLDIDVEVSRGEIVAVMGPNGAGKTTTLGLCAGLRRLATGTLHLDDRLVDDGDAVFVPPEKRDIGVVFQKSILFEHMSAAANIEFGLRHGRSKLAQHTARSLAMETLDMLGLTPQAHLLPRELSGGQARRVAIGRAVAPAPKLLLLDEPFSGIDTPSTQRVIECVDKYVSQADGTVLLVSHDAIRAASLSDRILSIIEARLSDSAASTPAHHESTNLLLARASNGSLELRDHEMSIQTTQTQASGVVVVEIPNESISLFPTRPVGSPRNVWRTVIEDAPTTHGPEQMLVRTGHPVPLSVAITGEAIDALSLRNGSDIWVAVKASEVRTHPASRVLWHSTRSGGLDQ